MPKTNYPNSVVFNKTGWTEVIKKPDWYFDFVKFINETKEKFGEDSEQIANFNKAVRHFFEQTLLENKVALASNGPNLDVQRLPIDTVVIHHTSNQPGYRLSYMNAVHLLNIYAPYFANPTVREERELKGQAIWSNHLKDGKQVFWAYHWFVRMDGTFERLLDDSQIGWHAGNWEINKRSVGICLDNDYDDKDPDVELLKKLAEHIKKNYPQVKSDKIIGHREAREGTTCPGKNFLNGWKPLLLEYLR